MAGIRFIKTFGLTCKEMIISRDVKIRSSVLSYFLPART